jgi:hypothetical protein
MFKLIGKASAIPGGVIDALKKNEDLWVGVVGDNLACPLIKLRDISHDTYNVSGLYVFFHVDNRDKLTRMLKRFKPDELHVYGEDEKVYYDGDAPEEPDAIYREETTIGTMLGVTKKKMLTPDLTTMRLLGGSGYFRDGYRVVRAWWD